MIDKKKKNKTYVEEGNISGLLLNHLSVWSSPNNKVISASNFKTSSFISSNGDGWGMCSLHKKENKFYGWYHIYIEKYIYLIYLINVYACKYMSNIPLDHCWFHLVHKNSVYFAIIIIKLFLLLCSLINIFTSAISHSVPK